MQLPVSFIHHIETLLGTAEAAEFMEALETEQPVSIRLNPAKEYPLPVAANAVPVPWCGLGRYLPGRPSFTFDPLFHAGCYYVQEASSMFVEQALKQHLPSAPVVALDLCAAPGGKSTLMRSLLPHGSLLVANEVMRNRAQILAENLTKWGDASVVVTNSDPADFTPMKHLFDVILVDAPCSGEGMFRKDPVAVSEWSDENVAVCRQRQHRILGDIWPALKPGGLLIYSTCTFNTLEDEETVQWLKRTYSAEVLPIAIQSEWGIKHNLLNGTDFPVYRFMPHRAKGEGFFLAALRKPIEEDVAVGCDKLLSTVVLKEKKNKKGKPEAQGKGGKAPQNVISRERLAALRGWIAPADDFTFMVEGDSVRAFPTPYIEVLPLLKRHLRIVQAGIELAEQKGRDWVPCHALAMSANLVANAFPTADVSLEEAIAYLRKEAITLPADTPRGIVLVTYRQMPLGFVKNIGNRANNLYPQEWRIRTTFVSLPSATNPEKSAQTKS